MGEPRHTPGKWLWKSDHVYVENPTADYAKYYGGELIAESIAPRDRMLIASAPMLLAACQAALEEDTGLACAQQLRDAIHAAGEMTFDEGENR